MRWRLVFWLGGLFILLTLRFNGWSRESLRVPWTGLILGWAIVGGILELAVLFRSLRSLPTTITPIGARPADGEIDLVEVRGALSEPNSLDARFGRWTASDPASSIPPLDRPWRHARPELLGDVVIFSFFVGQDGEDWNDEEIARIQNALCRAAAWIEREAMRWNAPVNVDLARTYFVSRDDQERPTTEIAFHPEGDHFAPIAEGEEVVLVASASRAAARLGFSDAADLIARIDARVQADHRVWLLHPRSEGRSMAISETVIGIPGVNLAVCFARESNFPGPLTRPPLADPSTFAHELLHLFGAHDKYGVSLRTFAAGTVTPRDIMRLSEKSLSRLRVDALTAREIGWNRDSRVAETVMKHARPSP